MEPLGYHIRSRLEDNRVIVHSDEQRRLVARVVLEQGRADGLLAFSLPDSHLHLEALCSGRAASRLNQRITASLKQRLNLPVSFVAYPHEPIGDQRYLFNTFRYLVKQHERHGLDLFSFWEATNLPDLLGMRLVGRYTRDNVSRVLPRVRRATILEWVGLSGLQPADGPLHEVVGATLAATGLVRLAGRAPRIVEARCALLDVVGARLKGRELASLLGTAERTVYDLKRRPVNPALVQAIRLQLGLRRIVTEGAVEPAFSTAQPR